MAYTSMISRSVEIGLRVAGLWPDSPYGSLHRFFWASTLVFVQTFQYRHAIMHIGKDDLAHLMDGLSTTMAYSLLLFKLTIFWLNRGVFREILTAMAEDWSECSGKSSFNVMASMASLSRRSSNVIIGLYSMCVVFYAVGVLVNYDFRRINDDLQTRAPPRELILKMELPFESDSSPNYEIVMITQFLHQLASATLVGVLNALIINLILHLSGQIDIACQSLSEISSKDTDHGSCVRAAIVRHQRIISLSEDVEKLLSYMALMQFLWNTLVVCALGFVIVTSVGNSDSSAMLVKSLLFYVGVTLEAFIFCYAGEYLSEKGKLIGSAAYNSPWYDLKPAHTKLLVILILRSQKTLTITIGKFMDLSLERFTAFLKGSASYVSVLHAMS